MLKIFGIVVILGALFIVLIGAGGAIANFVFPPEQITCINAETSMKKLEEAKKKLDAAKGTASESSAQYEFNEALREEQLDSASCGRAKDNFKFYGMIFSAVAVVGIFGVLFGGLLTLLGFRKKKTA